MFNSMLVVCQNNRNTNRREKKNKYKKFYDYETGLYNLGVCVCVLVCSWRLCILLLPLNVIVLYTSD